MKKIKIILKLALIGILGIVILYFSKYTSDASTVIYKSNGNLYINGEQVYNKNAGDLLRGQASEALGLTVSELEGLYSANMRSGGSNNYAGDTNAPNQICLAHWDRSSSDTEAYWELDLMLKITSSSSSASYTGYSVYGSSSYNTITSSSSTAYRYMVELSYALYQVYTVSYTNSSGSTVYPTFTPTKAAVGRLLALLYDTSVTTDNYISRLLSDIYDGTGVVTRTGSDGGGNTNANLDEENFENKTGQDFDELYEALMDDCEDYYSTFSNFRSISVDYSSAEVQSRGTQSDGEYVIVGPLTITYGGTAISSINIYDGNNSSKMSGLTIGWATSASPSSWNWNKSITSGTPIYLKIKGSSLPSSSTFRIEFVQEQMYFYNGLVLMFGRTNANSQQQGVVVANRTSITPSDSATIENIAYTSISIIKTDSLTDNLISGIGFQIYYTSSGTKYYLCANSSGVYTGWSTTATTHYTDDNGAINISSIPIQYGTTLTVTVQEVSTSSTQLYYIEDTNIIQSQTLTTSNTSSNPLIFSLENDPLSLTIEKRENTTSGDLMDGVGFKLQYSDGTWVYGTGNGHKSYTSTGTTYTTGDTSTGKVTITGLKKGTYTIYEVSIDSSVSPGYYLENQTGYDSSTGMVCWGTVTLNTSGTTSYTAGPYANITGALQITKYDEDEKTKLSGFKFVFVWASSASSTTYKYIYGTPGSTADPYAAISTGNYNTYTTDSNGQIKVEYLKAGIYYIYEIGTSGDPYYLTDQDEASNEPTSLQNSKYISSSWKYQGCIEIDSSTTLSSPATKIHTTCSDPSSCSSSTCQTTKIINYKRIQIAGYVWVDESSNKSKKGDGGYNSLYDDGETLVNGVKVYLYNKTTGEKVVLSDETENVTTSTNGTYTFGYEWGVQYRYISNYYIEFDYGSNEQLNETIDDVTYTGQDYIPVAFNGGVSTSTEIYANSSKAMMDSVAEYNDDLTGIATTYSYNPYTKIEGDQDSTYGLSAFLSSSLYNSATYTLEYINLGLKAYNPEYDIVENLMYVKIEINGYSYLYEYGYTKAVTDNDPFNVTVPTVSFRN